MQIHARYLVNAVHAQNVRYPTTLFNAVALQDFYTTTFRAALNRCNTATLTVNVMNWVCFAHRLATLTRNANAARPVREENAGPSAIQALVQPANCANMEPASQVAERTLTVQMTDHALTASVWIHASKITLAVEMPYARFPNTM